MPFSGTVAIRAMKDNDYQAQIFPGTTAGLQAAIDSLAGGKGKVSIGPGTLLTTTVISVHGGCHIQGCGPGSTVLQRATGSLATGDAAYSGNMIMTTAYGSNGTPPTVVGSAQSDITISDITLDGNYANFGAVNPSTPRHFGVYAAWTSGIKVSNVTVKNFLQTGIQYDSCRLGYISDTYIYKVGQYASPSARNGISILNNNAAGASDDYAKYFVVTNVIMESILDEAFSISNVKYVSVTDCVANDVDIVVEMEGDSSQAATAGHYTFSNIVSKNNRGEFLKWAPTTTGCTLSDVLMANCHMDAHATLHITDVIGLGSGSSTNQPISNISVADCTFIGCNSGDASGRNFLRIGTISTSPSKNISISNCTWQHGLPTSTRTDCDGIRVFTAVNGLTITGCNIRDAAGIGISFDPLYASMSDIVIRDTLVSDCTRQGLTVYSDTGAFDVKRVTLDNVTIKDPCEQSGAYAFDISSTFAAATISGLEIVNCRAVRTGANAITSGLRLLQSGTGVLDSIDTVSNDFSGCTGANITVTGTVTNVRYNETRYQSTPVAGILSSDDIVIQTPGDELKFTKAGSTTVWNSNAAGALKLGGWANNNLVIVGNGGNFVDVNAAFHVVSATCTVDSGLILGGGAPILKVFSAAGALNFDLTAVVVQDLTITVTGAADGDPVFLGVPNASVSATVQYTSWVSAANTVTVRARTAAVGENPASGTFRATVFHF